MVMMVMAKKAMVMRVTLLVMRFRWVLCVLMVAIRAMLMVFMF